MLIACWSCKGGSGTTVVATALAVLLSRTPSGRGALIVDLAGDVPTVLGVPEPAGPGLRQWLAEPDVSGDALSRLEVDIGGGLRMLACGPSADDPPGGRLADLVAVLSGDHRAVVADCGSTLTAPALALASGAALSLLVLRPCYLALRRALMAPIRPSGVVLIKEDGRSLGRHDVEEALGVPVRAEVLCEPAVARAVDAGLLAARMPRPLARSLRGAA